MSTTLASFPIATATPLAAVLKHCGFQPADDGFIRGDLRFRHAGRWGVLEQPLATPATADELGQLGLWRTVDGVNGPCRVFELPDTVLALADDAADTFNSEGEMNPFAACLEWALLTAGGELPSGWQPEPREVLDVLAPKGRLTVLAGAAVRQGELLHTPRRCALQFSILPAAAGELPALRRDRLREILRDAQNGWALVRLGFVGPGASPGVTAEIDFTGAPAAALQPLLSAGLDALRYVVARLVETVEVLSDASLASDALDSAAFNQPVTSTAKDPS